MFQTWFCKDASLPALWLEEKSLSYAELLEEIKAFKTRLIDQGIEKEDRIAFIAETTPLTVFIFFALLEIGASVCLLSSRIPQEKVSFHVELARASFFLHPKTLVVEKLQTTKFQDTAILLFTSGSSGTPKLVSLKMDHFLESAQGSLERLKLKKTDCWLISVPFFHVSGLSILFRCFLSGSSIAFTSNLLQGHRFATHLSLVPTQLIRILEKESSFPKLTCALIGGAPVSETLVKLALKKKLPLYLTYGMTETASQITMSSDQDALIPLHFGKPLPGKEVLLSEDGEILVKGSSLFSGYDTLNGPERLVSKEGWFKTGDLGAWNKEGNLEYRGRKDNLFISGGENIYPETIEQVLGSIPGVLQSLVVPIEDEEFGERPVAFVQMKQLLTKKEFHEKLTPHLPKFALPIYFFPFPEGLEKNLKLRRSDLKLWIKEFFLQKI